MCCRSNTTQCGLNGEQCMPFDTNAFAFICPAGCADVQVLEPHYVGAQKINYRNFVIGGPSVQDNTATSFYRGDSHICVAAIHAGITTNSRGGCGNVLRTGQQSSYSSVEAHGISSIGFQSNFPLSFAFESSAASSCTNSLWTYLGISVLFTSLLAIFVTSTPTFFWPVFVGVFFQVALISDPPYYADYNNVVSMAFRRFLPAAFVAQVLYKYSVHHTIHNLRAPLEKVILWVGGCWIGALNNLTFDRLPISRLTPHDLQQPGAIATVVSLVAIISVIAVGQAWCFRIEGRMQRYLRLYGCIAALLTGLILVPGMNLRIHHYILALIFLPGTSLQTRPSLLYQGILFGLFINGVAKWGFDSILQTPGQLLEGDELGSLLPEIPQPIISDKNITFTFETIAPSWDGISVLVNDVQRYLAFKPHEMTFQWTRLVGGEVEFFRFGYVKRLVLGGEWYGDFSPPAQWFSNATWLPGST
jgi:hypothetical protein